MGWDVTYKRFECSFTKEELQLMKTAVRAMIKADPEYISRDWIDFNFRVEKLGDVYIPPPRPRYEDDGFGALPIPEGKSVEKQIKECKRQITLLTKRIISKEDIRDIQINQAWLFMHEKVGFTTDRQRERCKKRLVEQLDKFEAREELIFNTLLPSLKELE